MATATVNPYRGQIWLLAAEVGVIFLFATIADQSEQSGKIMVLLLVTLGTIFVIVHGAQVKADLTTLGAGDIIHNAPTIQQSSLSPA